MSYDILALPTNIVFQISNESTLYALEQSRAQSEFVALQYLYSGIQEAVLQSDWLFAILHRNFVSRVANGRGMSKFKVK